MAKRKLANEPGEDVWTGPGRTGPINWPQFDLQQPLHTARSFAQWALPANCGPLQTGEGTLLPAFNPRNQSFITVDETGVNYKRRRARNIQSQFEWLQKNYPEAPVPPDILRSLIKMDNDNRLSYVSNYQSNARLDQRAHAGFPSYDMIAAHLRGNRLATVPLHGSLTAVISATGQIGEVVTLTLLRTSELETQTTCRHSDPHLDPVSEGCGAGGGIGASQSRPTDATASTSGTGTAVHIEALPAAHLSVNKTIWEVIAKQYRSPWTSSKKGEAGSEEGGGGDGADAALGSCRVVWIAVRCNYCINVLLAYQVDPSDWRSWRLEWRASHTTQRLIASLAWNPHLNELAFMLVDGSAWIAETNAVVGGVAAVLRQQLRLRPVLKPMPPAVRCGYGKMVMPRLRNVVGSEPMAVLIGEGRLCLSYGGHPRVLLVARGRTLLKVDLAAHGHRHKCSLLHYLARHEGNFWSLTTGPSLSNLQLAVSPQFMLYLVVSVSERSVLIFDTRRGASSCILSCAHGIRKPELPTMVSLWVGPWRDTADSIAAKEAAADAAAAAVGPIVNIGSDDSGESDHMGEESDKDRDSEAKNALSSSEDDDEGGGGGREVAAQQQQQQQQQRRHRRRQRLSLRQQWRRARKVPRLWNYVQGLWGPRHKEVVQQGLRGALASAAFGASLDASADIAQAEAAADEAAAALDTFAATAAKAVTPAPGSLHIVVLTGNERLGDSVCMEVVLEDAPLGFQVHTLPAPDIELSTDQLHYSRMPYLEPVQSLTYGYTAAGVAAQSRTETLPAVGVSQTPSVSGGCGAAAAGPSTDPALQQPAVVAETRPKLSDALWRPSCLSHMNVLGLPYPLCKPIQQELGTALSMALRGARWRAYDDSAGTRRSHVGQELILGDVDMYEYPDMAGLAIFLPEPFRSSSCSRSSSDNQSTTSNGSNRSGGGSSTSEGPLLLIRLSYDGDLLLQPLRRCPPLTAAPTRGGADSLPWYATANGTATANGAPTHGSLGVAAAVGSCTSAAGLDSSKLSVEVLESPFFLADLPSRIPPSRFRILRRVYDNARMAHVKMLTLQEAMAKAAVPKITHQRRNEDTNLTFHYYYLSAMLRWAMNPDATTRGSVGTAAASAAGGGGGGPGGRLNPDLGDGNASVLEGGHNRQVPMVGYMSNFQRQQWPGDGTATQSASVKSAGLQIKQSTTPHVACRFDRHGVAVVHPLRPGQLPHELPLVVHSAAGVAEAAEVVEAAEADPMLVETESESETSKTEAGNNSGGVHAWGDVRMLLKAAAPPNATLVSELSQAAFNATKHYRENPMFEEDASLFRSRLEQYKGSKTLYTALRPLRRKVLSRLLPTALWSRDHEKQAPAVEAGVGAPAFGDVSDGGGGNPDGSPISHPEEGNKTLSKAQASGRAVLQPFEADYLELCALAGQLEHVATSAEDASQAAVQAVQAVQAQGAVGEAWHGAGGGQGGGSISTAAATRAKHDSGDEGPWISLRSMGHTIPAIRIAELSLNANVAVTVPAVTSLSTGGPPPANPMKVQLRSNLYGGGGGGGGDRSLTRADTLAYLHSLVAIQLANLRTGVSVFVPEPRTKPEQRHEMKDTRLCPPLPRLQAQWGTANDRKLLRAKGTAQISKVLYEHYSCRQNHHLEVLKDPVTEPGSVAPVLTPLGASMLERLIQAWPAYDKQTAAAAAITTDAQPRILVAPEQLSDWAESLRPWPKDGELENRKHPYGEGEDPKRRFIPKAKKFRFFRTEGRDESFRQPHVQLRERSGRRKAAVAAEAAEAAEAAPVVETFAAAPASQQTAVGGGSSGGDGAMAPYISTGAAAPAEATQPYTAHDTAFESQQQTVQFPIPPPPPWRRLHLQPSQPLDPSQPSDPWQPSQTSSSMRRRGSGARGAAGRSTVAPSQGPLVEGF